jgi:cobalt-zinc-cadmium efflux system membrane fusion protein
MKFPKTTILCLLTGSMGWTACEKPQAETTATTDDFCIPDSLMKNTTLDTVYDEPVISSLKLSGKITSDEDRVVNVYAVISGHVAGVKVSLGDHVEKGQLLATVNSTDMAGYASNYKTAQSELAIAKKNMDVTAEMKNSGVASDKDYLTAQNEYQKALAEYNKSAEVLKIYGGSAGDGDSAVSGMIKAPISGFIVDKNINAGQELRADAGNALFTISDLKEVWATANVYETDIDKIREGRDVEVTTLSYPDKKFTGKIERISSTLNPETSVLTIKIRLQNADYLLKPGMFAIIDVLFPEKQKMTVVPAHAVLFDDNKSYVVQFHKRCDVDLQEITINKSFGDKYYVIDDSLKAGDMVVDRNALFIYTALKKR